MDTVQPAATHLDKQPVPGQSAIKQIARGIVIAVVIGLVFVTFYGTRKPDAQDQDFGAYYRAGQAVLAGRSPYNVGSHGSLGAYMYAPIFAHFFFRFFAELPYSSAVRVFLLINWLATVACVWLCLQLTRKPGRDLFWLGVLALVPTGTYLWADLHNGQVGTLLLLACLLWLYLDLSGRSFVGGVVLSLAIALKLYPALLLPYFLLRKDWSGLTGVAVGLLILFLAPAAMVGIAHVGPLHAEWLRFCVTTQTADQTIRTGNQSLLGVLARLPFISDGNQKHWSVEHLAALNHLYPLIVVTLTGMVYGLFYLAGRGQSERSRERILTEISLLLLWMTIASPRAWTFNFAAEILPGFLMAAALMDRRPRAWIGAVALISVLVALTLNTNGFHFGDHWSLSAFILQNKHFDALVLLGTAVAVVRAR